MVSAYESSLTWRPQMVILHTYVTICIGLYSRPNQSSGTSWCDSSTRHVQKCTRQLTNPWFRPTNLVCLVTQTRANLKNCSAFIGKVDNTQNYWQAKCPLCRNGCKFDERGYTTKFAEHIVWLQQTVFPKLHARDVAMKWAYVGRRLVYKIWDICGNIKIIKNTNKKNHSFEDEKSYFMKLLKKFTQKIFAKAYVLLQMVVFLR